MQSFYADVVEFHKQFELPHPGNTPVRNLDAEQFGFRFGFMVEELREYQEAVAAGDLVKAADALVDLTYVVLGTAAFHGFQFKPMWDAVHRANMAKIRTPSAADSKRGSSYDVIKPPGWVSPEPEIRDIILGVAL